MIDEKHAAECREIHARELRVQLRKCLSYLDETPPAAGWQALVYLYAEDLLFCVLNRLQAFPKQDFDELLNYCTANLCGYHSYDFETYKTRFGQGISDELVADLEERAVQEAKELLESI